MYLIAFSQQALPRLTVAHTQERIAIGQKRFRVGQELAIFRDGAADFLGEHFIYCLLSTDGAKQTSIDY